jgi:hypothetical protein
VTNLEVADRVYTTTAKQAFATLKDHKPSFNNNPTCRLINPSKPEIGKISQQILAKINATVREKIPNFISGHRKGPRPSTNTTSM